MESARDVLAFVVLALAALVLVQISSLNTLAIGVALSGLILLSWAVLLLVLAPETVFNSSGSLIAPYGNRNGLAYSLLQAVPAAFAMRLTFSAGRVVKWLSVVVLSTGVIATTSKTSLLVLGMVVVIMVVVIMVVVIMVVGGALRRRRIFGFLLAMTAVITLVLGSLNFGRLLDVFGKGASINGRVPMWEALLPLIGQRPLTGYGWSMSWPVGAPPSRAVQESLDGVVLFHAHNEILNWLITTGVIGCALVICIYGLLFWAGLRLFRESEFVGVSWILLGATVLFLRGFSDISETSPPRMVHSGYSRGGKCQISVRRRGAVAPKMDLSRHCAAQVHVSDELMRRGVIVSRG